MAKPGESGSLSFSKFSSSRERVCAHGFSAAVPDPAIENWVDESSKNDHSVRLRWGPSSQSLRQLEEYCAATQDMAKINSSTSSSSVPSIELTVGVTVRVIGLHENAHMNGTTGLLVDFFPAQHRWRVMFEDGQPDKLLKPINLEAIAEADPISETSSLEIPKKSADKKNPVAVNEVYFASTTMSAFKNPTKIADKKNSTAAEQVRLAPTTTVDVALAPALKWNILNPGKFGHDALGLIVRNARPDWKEKDVVAVMNKLQRVQVVSGMDLLLALRNQGAESLNEKLKTSGEKVFTAETIRLFSGTPAGVTTSPMIPRGEFSVIHEFVHVREEPTVKSRSLGKKQRGERVFAVFMTFDGWLRLDGSPGWVLLHISGKGSSGALLEPVGGTSSHNLSDTCDVIGPRKFQVRFKPHMPVRAAPSRTAPVTNVKCSGVEVYAEVQTFDGWVHLIDGEGWMLRTDQERGELLSPVLFGNQTNAHSEHAQDMGKGDKTSIEVSQVNPSKQSTVAGTDTQKRQCSLSSTNPPINRPREKFGKMIDLVNPSVKSTTAAPLREVTPDTAEVQSAKAVRSDCEELLEETPATLSTPPKNTDANEPDLPADIMTHHQESEFGPNALNTALAGAANGLHKGSGQCTPLSKDSSDKNAELLEALAAAAKSGNPTTVKAARDAAKKGGISVKEIARVYALHSA